MITALNHVNETQQRLFDNTISNIVAALNPVKILCYGNRTHEDSMWSCFLASQSVGIYTNYDLLIITQESQSVKEHELLDRLSKCEEESVRITAVTHTIAAVKEALQKGSSFFTTSCQKGIVVYDSGNSTLEFSTIVQSIDTIESIEKYWTKSFGLAERFYSSAVDCATNEQNDVAVFMLHQAVELACIAAIKTQIGYRPATHNLKRLLSLMENFTSHGLVVFPRITKEETELYNVLHRAYSDVRYKEEYRVSGNTVFILIERVRNLLDVVGELYRNKKMSLEAAFSQPNIDIRELTPFESIGIDTFADVVLQKGEKESIRIECENEITHVIKTSVENKRLWITTDTEGNDIFSEAILHITYATLKGLVVNHSGKITCAEPIEVPWLGIVQNGRGNIDLQVEVSTLDATITKIGGLKISGSADKANILNTGAGAFDGIKLETSEAKVTIKDSGSVSIYVEDELNAFLEGDGNLVLKGEPRLKTFEMP